MNSKNPTPPASSPMLSIVVPMYNEAEGIDIFFERITPIVQGVTNDWEIICINDGSTDTTLEIVKAKATSEPRIKYISLSRNFGKETALTAGLHHAHGKAVIPIDADLQDPPELIPEMVQQWQAGFKVVLATRSKRDDDTWFKRNSAEIFYKLIGKMTRFPIPANTGDYRLMDQQVVEVIRLLPERSRFMKGLFAWVGFESTTLYFEREPRAKGEAKQNIRALWNLAKDGIFSFTTLPLRVSTYLGAIISFFSFLYAAFLILYALFTGVDVPGYTSIMVVVLCIGGIQLLSLGIIGEYIGRIYRESKKRPLYVVEEKNISS